MAYDPLPAPVAMLIAWAKADSDLFAVFADRVSHRLPEDPPLPHLTVTRIGGGRPGSVGPPLSLPFIQFDVYTGGDVGGGPDTVTAEQHGILLEAVLASVDNVTVAGHGLFYSFDVVNARPFPEPAYESGRYLIDGFAALRV